MPQSRADVAFHMFSVVGRDWPLDPRHVQRAAKLLDLLECVPKLLRSEDESDVMAGAGLAGSLIACYAVTNRWQKVVDTLLFIGQLDEAFRSEQVAHWATSTKWHASMEDYGPAKWRPKVLAAIDGPFFRQNVDSALKQRLEEIERKRPSAPFENERPWKQRKKINIAFDMADEFNKVACKSAAGPSQLEVELGLRYWVLKLFGSRHKKDILAGCFWSSSLLMAHANADEWGRFCEVLETIGSFDGQLDDEYVSFEATSLVACYTHPHNLRLIPNEYHRRITNGMQLPFLQNHFDAEHFEMETNARNRHMAAEDQGIAFAARLLEAFPELQLRYQKAIEPYGPRTPPQRSICTLVLLPEVRAAVRRKDSRFFGQLSAFLEGLLEDGWEVVDIDGQSVITMLLCDKRVRAALQPYVGNKMREALANSATVSAT